MILLCIYIYINVVLFLKCFSSVLQFDSYQRSQTAAYLKLWFVPPRGEAFSSDVSFPFCSAYVSLSVFFYFILFYSILFYSISAEFQRWGGIRLPIEPLRYIHLCSTLKRSGEGYPRRTSKYVIGSIAVNIVICTHVRMY